MSPNAKDSLFDVNEENSPYSFISFQHNRESIL
jgi:hypothetical protein